MFSLTSAHQLAAQSVEKAQQRYKKYYDRHAKSVEYRVGDWIFIRFPAEKTGRNRKMSHPWHGPCRVTSNRIYQLKRYTFRMKAKFKFINRGSPDALQNYWQVTTGMEQRSIVLEEHPNGSVNYKELLMYRRSKAMLLTMVVRRILEMLNKRSVIVRMNRGTLMNQFLSQQDVRITHVSLLADIQITVHTP